MFITVQMRSVYGNDLVYPMDDAARLFAKLTGSKTFNDSQLATIKALGYAFIWEPIAPERPEWIYDK